MDPVHIVCPCPPKSDGQVRHPDGDDVWLRERLDFRTATILRQSVKWMNIADATTTLGEVMGALTELYLLHTIERWTLVDAKGRALEPSKQNVRDYLLPNDAAAMTVGDAADAAYMETVLLPLVAQGRTSSSSGPTEPTISAINGHGSMPRKPSKRSSITSIPTVVTGPMTSSLGGASNTSRNSA